MWVRTFTQWLGDLKGTLHPPITFYLGAYSVLKAVHPHIGINRGLKHLKSQGREYCRCWSNFTLHRKNAGILQRPGGLCFPRDQITLLERGHIEVIGGRVGRVEFQLLPSELTWKWIRGCSGWRLTLASAFHLQSLRVRIAEPWAPAREACAREPRCWGAPTPF